MNSHQDLGLKVSSNLLWSEGLAGHTDPWISLKGTSQPSWVSAQLNLYKSTVVAIISYSSPCWYASRGEMRKLELLQRRLTKWILPTVRDYKKRLDFWRCSEFHFTFNYWTFSHWLRYKWEHTISVERTSYLWRTDPDDKREKFQKSCRKTQFESTHNEFFARTSRLSFLPFIDITRPSGLKPSFLQIFWQNVTENFSENNLCSWRIACRCHNCIGWKTHKLLVWDEVPLNMLL